MTRDLKTLQKIWYKKLEESGFKDAERLVAGELLLKTTSSSIGYAENDMTRASIEEYYRRLGGKALDQDTIYRNEVDKHILIRHSEGISLRVIRDELASKQTPRCRNSIYNIIRRYEDIWKIKEMTDTYTIKAYGCDLPPSYEPLIYSKWLRSLRYGNDLFKLVDPAAYYEAYSKYITAIVKQAEIRLAVLSDDPDVVLGFSVSRGHVLDYCHVHKDNREIGIATMLVPKEITTISHLTKTAKLIWDKPKYRHLKFNPFVPVIKEK